METVIEPLADEPSMERVITVTHDAINKAMMMHVKKHGMEDFWTGGLQKNCNVIILEYNNGSYNIIEETKTFY